MFNRSMEQKEHLYSQDRKSLVLAHPDKLLRKGIIRILTEHGFEVVGESSTQQSLYELAVQHTPQIILTDLSITEPCIDFIRTLNQKMPDSTIVILAKAEESESCADALKSGARGYLSADLSPEEFIQSLNLLARGDVVVSKDMADDIKTELDEHYPVKAVDELTDREREVLKLVGCGSTNREMAQALYISEHTIKVHLRTILNKLNLRNKQQAAAFAVKEGLVEDIDTESSSTSTL
jgi:DNA-binding NarL/FixJ family response regulator